MKLIQENEAPADGKARQAIKPVICYPPDTLPPVDRQMLNNARQTMHLIETVTVPPRDAATFEVPAGHFFRIVSSIGAQVGDLNLWSKHNLMSGFIQARPELHGTSLNR